MVLPFWVVVAFGAYPKSKEGKIFLTSVLLWRTKPRMSNPAEIATKEVITEIVARIRSLRRSKNISLDVLSKKTGFAKSYLSEIETVKKEPPIRALSKIAFALEVDFLFLLTGETRNSSTGKISIVKKGERQPIHGPYGSRGYLYESLTYKKLDRIMDAYVVTIGPEFPPEPFEHEGQEVAYVLEGNQELFYGGETYFLEEGDCFCFDSDRPHYSRTVGDRPGKILVVLATKGK
jgi:quercetin dioxygenase-like cupin family protein